MKTHEEHRWLSAALLLASALVLVRSLRWLLAADVSLDSDEAIVGLMAKHLLEGRAFPLFYYGLGYLLGIEAWAAVPLFAVFGASAFVLRAMLLAMNVGLGVGLVLALVRLAGLRPWAALAAASFVLVPAPTAVAELMHASGGNIEPFLAVVALWLLRARPIAFGVVLAFGFMNREFVAYGLAALLLIEAADGTLFQPAVLKARAVSLAVFGAIWGLVQALRPYSSSVGPGSPVNLDLSETTSVTKALGFVTLEPGRIAADVWSLLTVQLPLLFGGRAGTPLAAAEASSTWERLVGSWALLAALLAVALLVSARRLWANPALLRSERVQFPVYLLLVGCASALAYAVLRGGAMNPGTLRYTLLALLAPVGIAALFLVVQPKGTLRTALAASIALWASVLLADNVVQAAVWARNTEVPGRVALRRDLLANHVRYGSADYWTAYSITFVTGERVKLTANAVVRVIEYDRLFFGHPESAVEIRTEPCDGCRKAGDVWVAPVKR